VGGQVEPRGASLYHRDGVKHNRCQLRVFRWVRVTRSFMFHERIESPRQAV